MKSHHRTSMQTTPGDNRQITCPEHHRYLKGQIIFHSRQESSRAFKVASGEVLIVRNGNMVDIVEAGETLDPNIWQHAVAIAWNDCRLIKMS